MKKILATFIILICGLAVAEEPISPEELTELIFANKRGMMGPPEMTLKNGDDIIDFELPDLGGSTVKSKTVRKGRVLVVRIAKLSDFYWEKQLHVFVQMRGEYIDGLEIIDIISQDETPLDEVLEKYENLKVGFNVVVDEKGEVAGKYGIKEGPAVLVFDTNGKLIESRRIFDIWNFSTYLRDLFAR